MSKKVLKRNGYELPFSEQITLPGLLPFEIAAPQARNYELHDPRHVELKPDTIQRLYNEFSEMLQDCNDDTPVIYLSAGNSKTHTFSVSLPTLFTCGTAAHLCGLTCYSCRGCAGYRHADNYRLVSNLSAYIQYKAKYAKTLEWIINSLELPYFRYNVDGDIGTAGYFDMIVHVAKHCENCSFLVFTKQYNIVNEWIDARGDLPDNLHVVFSAWPGLVMNNPHDIATCHVNFARGGLLTVDEKTLDPYTTTHCTGDCSACQKTGTGCFNAVPGDTVIITEH